MNTNVEKWAEVQLREFLTDLYFRCNREEIPRFKVHKILTHIGIDLDVYDDLVDSL